MPERAEPGVRLMVWALEMGLADQAADLGRIAAAGMGRQVTQVLAVVGGPRPEPEPDTLDSASGPEWAWRLLPLRQPIDRRGGA